VADNVDVLQRYRARAVFVAYVLLVLWVFAAGGAHGVVASLWQLALGGVVLYGCVLDARLHDKHFEHAFALPLLVTWPVSLAVYLVWTRGSRGVLLYLLLLLGGLALIGFAVALTTCVPTCSEPPAAR